MDDAKVLVEDTVEDHDDVELIELGEVSEETKGGFFGSSFDPGAGRCWC